MFPGNADLRRAFQFLREARENENHISVKLRASFATWAPLEQPAKLRRRMSTLSQRIEGWGNAKSTAVANAYLASGADRRPYMETVALCASRFQDDPHNQKITASTFEEYGLNSTHLKDRLLLATPRLLAGWVKMPGERDCFARFEREWMYN